MSGLVVLFLFFLFIVFLGNRNVLSNKKKKQGVEKNPLKNLLAWLSKRKTTTTSPAGATPAKRPWVGSVLVRVGILLALVLAVWGVLTLTNLGSWFVSARECGMFYGQSGGEVFWPYSHFVRGGGVGGACSGWERYMGLLVSMPDGWIENQLVGRLSIWWWIVGAYNIALLWVQKENGISFLWKRFPLGILSALLGVLTPALAGWYARSVILINAPTDASSAIVTLLLILAVLGVVFLLHKVVQITLDPKGWIVYARHPFAGFWRFLRFSTIATVVLGWLQIAAVA